MKSDPVVMVSAHARVWFDASNAHGPLDDVSLIVPGMDPAVGRNVAHVCCDQVPLDRMHPTLVPCAVYTWIVPLSPVAVDVYSSFISTEYGRGGAGAYGCGGS